MNAFLAEVHVERDMQGGVSEGVQFDRPSGTAEAEFPEEGSQSELHASLVSLVFLVTDIMLSLVACHSVHCRFVYVVTFCHCLPVLSVCLPVLSVCLHVWSVCFPDMSVCLPVLVSMFICWVNMFTCQVSMFTCLVGMFTCLVGVFACLVGMLP